MRAYYDAPGETTASIGGHNPQTSRASIPPQVATGPQVAVDIGRDVAIERINSPGEASPIETKNPSL